MIAGISNTDLREWLSEIGSSLEELRITDSTFTRHHDEEHAVDATMSKMSALRIARFSGDNVVSTLTIERKVMHSGNGGCHITIYDAPSLNPLGLVRALGCTGFTGVICGSILSPSQRKEALEIASRRGIRLSV